MAAKKYAGSKHDLPPDIAAVLSEGVKARVVYWSRPDSSQPIIKHRMCPGNYPVFAVPCCWPFFFPVLYCAMTSKQVVMRRVVVVTDQAVEVIDLPHARGFIPGCRHRPPLDRERILKGSVTTVMIAENEDTCLDCQCPDVAKMTIFHRNNHRVPRRTELCAHTDMKRLKVYIMRLVDPVCGVSVVQPHYTGEYRCSPHIARGLEMTQAVVNIGAISQYPAYDTRSYQQQPHISAGACHEIYPAYDTRSYQQQPHIPVGACHEIYPAYDAGS